MKWYEIARRSLWIVLIVALALPVFSQRRQVADADDALPSGQMLPNTGQRIMPLAPRAARFVALNPGFTDNPTYTAGQAVTSVMSPDGRTLLVLTSGYNLVKTSAGATNAAESTQFIFVYDISKPAPVRSQVIQVQNTYNGIVFDPAGTTFYVAGGVDDNVHVYTRDNNAKWVEQSGSPIALGHSSGVGRNVSPQAAGIAVTRDGTKLVVANYYNDSISILTKSATGWSKPVELDLRPGKLNPVQSGVPGGEYPYWVVIKGNDTAYVSSIRDREIVVVDIRSVPVVVKRIKLSGQPNKMVLNGNQSVLYAAQDNTDSVAVINTSSNQLVESIPATAPAGLLPANQKTFKGNNTNSVTLSRDEKRLYLTNGWMNDVAVIDLARSGGDRVIGLVPTGWYPNSVGFSADGTFMYVVNGKSPTGPNPQYCRSLTTGPAPQCTGSNQYGLQLIKAGLQSFPTPSVEELRRLTKQVADNNHFGRRPTVGDAAKLAFLRQHIHHIIYIVKENRTYDQILGDLEMGNGDPSIVQFPESVTPNQHRLAREFVDLDNFYDTSEVSYEGWSWSTSARAPDLVERQTPVNYASRGLSYDSEGTNRNINVGYETLPERLQANPLTPNDPDILPGKANAAAPDGPDGAQGAGYLWNSALRAKLSLRNYGFFIDLDRYNLAAPNVQYSIPETIEPAASSTVVSYVANDALRPHTDPYFRGYDQTFPDFYRFKEWEREFDTKYASDGLPALTLLRLPHDHTGNFGIAILGVNTPELQIADNDYAVGLVVQKIATSRYKDDTLVFVIEDDAQDGGDHMDSHRSIAFVVGPYVKHKAVVSTSYNTVSLIRTIEDILGIGYLNLNDASSYPMTEVFDSKQKEWTFQAVVPRMLYNTQLPLPPQAAGQPVPRPTHDASYWAEATQGMDFSVEDRVDAEQYNLILWQGLMGSKPYPYARSGVDLRQNREELLKQYRETM